MTFSKRLRLRIVMRFARWLGVPVDVNGNYFGVVNMMAKREGVRD